MVRYNALRAFTIAAAVTSVAATSSDTIANLKDKIKNVVVLIFENRSFDNLLGGQTLPGLDNHIQSGPFCNPVNLSNPSAGTWCAQARTTDQVTNDLNHAVWGNTFQFYGTFHPDEDDIQSGCEQATMEGFVTEQIRLWNQYGVYDDELLADEAMYYYPEDLIPTVTNVVQDFVTFNRWFCGVPGPTPPNRQALWSGTTQGHVSDSLAANGQLPQRSIFQQLSETNHTWINYESQSNGADAYWWDWVNTSGARTTNVKEIAQFYTDAAAGTLPEFAMLNPTCCVLGTNSMHPTGLVYDGEVLLKDVYDALRASPQWNETLFFISFDENGGFYDNVAPPLATRPDNATYTEAAPDGLPHTIYFDRLGARVPTFLISPWVAQGYVENYAYNSNGQYVAYSAESLLRTLGYLWDFEPFNPRVANAPAFDHLILTSPRDTVEALDEPISF